MLFNATCLVGPEGLLYKYRKVNPWIPWEVHASPHDVPGYEAELFPVARRQRLGHNLLAHLRREAYGSSAAPGYPPASFKSAAEPEGNRTVEENEAAIKAVLHARPYDPKADSCTENGDSPPNTLTNAKPEINEGNSEDSTAKQ